VAEQKQTGNAGNALYDAVEELLASSVSPTPTPPKRARATTVVQPSSPGSITWLTVGFEVFNSATPVSWTDYELPSEVPSSCSAVILAYTVTRAAIGGTAPLFEARISPDYEAVPIAASSSSTVAGDKAASTAICPVQNGTFQYQFSGSTDSCVIRLVGYY